MNNTTKTILLIATLGGVAFLGYAIYKKTVGKAAGGVTPIPTAATQSGTNDTSNTIHAVSDGINAVVGLFGAFTSSNNDEA